MEKLVPDPEKLEAEARYDMLRQLNTIGAAIAANENMLRLYAEERRLTLKAGGTLRVSLPGEEEATRKKIEEFREQYRKLEYDYNHWKGF